MTSLVTLLGASVRFSDAIGDAVDRASLALGDKRIACAGACFHVALEHHGAVLKLVRESCAGSAFALLRPQFEAFVRGVWFKRCASIGETEQFFDGAEPPKLGNQLAAIEQHDWYSSDVLTRFKAVSWSVMCDYTHTGSRQVGRRFRQDEVIQNYSEDEQVELLMATNLFSALTAFEIADLLASDSITLSVQKAYDELPKKH